jgi:uncharacterized protein YggE
LISTASVASAATVTHISASGEGTVAVVPDEAAIRASITTNAERAEDAVSQSNTIYNRAVNAVVAMGVARDDVTLAYYNFNYNPRPAGQPNEPPPIGQFGYVVTRSFDVKVRNVNKSGDIADALTKAGVTNIESVTFGSSNPAHARSEATAKALADARAKAEDAAKAAGLHITGIEQITFGGGGTVVPLVRAATLSAQPAPMAPTVFDAASVKVTTFLTVIYLAQP